MFDWFWNLLYSLGFFGKDATVILVGLDNAGKTTLIHKLKHGLVQNFPPTQRAQLEEISVGRVKFRTWDLGGHLQVRSFWKEYLIDIDAIIFVVDSADRDRMEEARKELEELLNDEDLEETTFMILANKIDVEGYCSELEIERNLNLNIPANRNQHPEGGRLINLFMCSFLKGIGVNEAFAWLSDVV